MMMELPEMITSLPEIEMPIEGIRGYLIQGEVNQSIIFVVKAGVYIPEHSHAAQWGVIVEGEFEITFCDTGEKILYQKGDTYYVPGNTVHAGRFITDVISFDIYNDKNKFQVRRAA